MSDFHDVSVVALPRNLSAIELAQKLYPETFQELGLEKGFCKLGMFRREVGRLVAPDSRVSEANLVKQREALQLALDTLYDHVSKEFFVAKGLQESVSKQTELKSRKWHVLVELHGRPQYNSQYFSWRRDCYEKLEIAIPDGKVFLVSQEPDSEDVTVFRMGSRETYKFKGPASALADWARQNGLLYHAAH